MFVVIRKTTPVFGIVLNFRTNLDMVVERGRRKTYITVMLNDVCEYYCLNDNKDNTTYPAKQQ